ncbi:hypothetical protein M1N42_04725 [Thermodesulfovibrionales bacterium]|nr:hypothetical protein [Thermodesulfovibrionales bacterium]
MRIGSLDPQIQHRFVYCRNNPVNAIDPYGLSEWEKLMEEHEQLVHEFFWEVIGLYAIPAIPLITLGVIIGWTPMGVAMVAGGGFFLWRGMSVKEK